MPVSSEGEAVLLVMLYSCKKSQVILVGLYHVQCPFLHRQLQFCTLKHSLHRCTGLAPLTPHIYWRGKKRCLPLLGAISLSCHNAFYHLCRPLFQSCHCLNLKNHPQSQARSVSAECRNLTEQICARGSWSQKSSYSAIRKSKLSKQAVPPASSDPAFVSL